MDETDGTYTVEKYNKGLAAYVYLGGTSCSTTCQHQPQKRLEMNISRLRPGVYNVVMFKTGQWHSPIHPPCGPIRFQVSRTVTATPM